MEVGAKPPARIPVNLIAGPLGVGKTTMINHLLSHRPEGEQWAILVNEYGLVGLDAALMEDGSGGVKIKEVAGGCICCTAGFMFEMSLVLLLQRRPDRLLIEPTGLAALSGILDTLGRPGIREAVDVRSILCLLDPGRFREDIAREEVQDQLEAADVLLATRADVASEEQLADFEDWASGLFPPKRLVGRAEQGRIPVELLDLVSERSEEEVPRGGSRHLNADDEHEHEHEHGHEHGNDDGHGHGHGHGNDDGHGHGNDGGHGHEEEPGEAHPFLRLVHQASPTSTVGWICWNGLTFHILKLTQWLDGLAVMPGVRRVKAVMRTHMGWTAFNLAGTDKQVRPSGYRRDSRLELVIDGDELPDVEALEAELRSFVVAPVDVHG